MSRGRGHNPDRLPRVKPVERVELKEGSTKWRAIAAILLLAIGLGCIGYALSKGLGRDPGWTQIEALNQSSESVSSEIALLYDLGASGTSPTAEYKALSMLYTDLCARAYRLFNAQYGFADFKNPYYLNRHPGEAVTVDPALYAALEEIVKADSRILFAGPYYTDYMNLFQDTEDSSAATVDPYKSQEVAASFQELSVFTADPEHVRLELLGDNTVRLHVSQAYRDYAAENGIENFIDFYWTRNAFAVDYIAEELLAKGYTFGTVSSFDGFVRSVDSRDTSYSYNLYGQLGDEAYNAARLDYIGATSLVYLRSFRVNDRDEVYYRYESGEQRHPYVDPADGLCKNAVDSLVFFTQDQSCARVLLSMLPVYIGEEWDSKALSALDTGVYAVYVDGGRIVYSDPSIKLQGVHEKFTAEKLN